MLPPRLLFFCQRQSGLAPVSQDGVAAGKRLGLGSSVDWASRLMRVEGQAIYREMPPHTPNLLIPGCVLIAGQPPGQTWTTPSRARHLAGVGIKMEAPARFIYKDARWVHYQRGPGS